MGSDATPREEKKYERKDSATHQEPFCSRRSRTSVTIVVLLVDVLTPFRFYRYTQGHFESTLSYRLSNALKCGYLMFYRLILLSTGSRSDLASLFGEPYEEAFENQRRLEHPTPAGLHRPSGEVDFSRTLK